MCVGAGFESALECVADREITLESFRASKISVFVLLLIAELSVKGQSDGQIHM